MANVIRIKRSTTTNTPASLAQGELAWSENTSGNSTRNLFIGEAGPTVTTIITDDETSRGGTAAAPNDSAQDNQTLTTGLGIDGADAGTTGSFTMSLATTELTNTAPAAADQFVFNDATDELPKKQVASSIPLSIWGAAAAQVNFADQDVNRPVLEDYGIKHTSPTVSGNAVTVNCNNGNSFYIDMDPATAAVTLTLSNPSPSGTYCEVNLMIQMGTPAYGITWPGSVTWQGGSAPTLTTIDNVVDLVHLFTVDGGTNWYGTFATGEGSGGGTVTSVTAGVGIVDNGTATDPDLALDFSELTDMTASISGTTEFILQNGATESRKAASEIQLQFFDNSVAEFVSENDTLVVADWNWVLDEDNMSTNSDTHVPTQQSVKAYVDSAVTGGMVYQGGYNAATNTPALDTGSPSITVGDTYTVTAAGSFFTETVEVGDVLIAEVTSSDAAALSDWTILQNNIGAASETVAGYVELADQTETDAGSSTTLAVNPNRLHNTTFDGGSF